MSNAAPCAPGRSFTGPWTQELPDVPPAPPVTLAPTHAPAASDAASAADSSRCMAASTCGLCTSLPTCGWCPLERRCVEGDKLGPRHTQCALYDFMMCPNLACEERASCSECTVDPTCGWCATTAACISGERSGPSDLSSCPPPLDMPNSRSLWIHQSTTQQCHNAPVLHPATLWSKLRGMMHKSQARIARLQASVREPFERPQHESPMTPSAPLEPPPPAPSPVYSPVTEHNIPAGPAPAVAVPDVVSIATTTMATTTTATMTMTTTTAAATAPPAEAIPPAQLTPPAQDAGDPLPQPGPQPYPYQQPPVEIHLNISQSADYGGAGVKCGPQGCSVGAGDTVTKETVPEVEPLPIPTPPPAPAPVAYVTTTPDLTDSLGIPDFDMGDATRVLPTVDPNSFDPFGMSGFT